eukprot:256442-Chlamydomonas_euryale.AAC.1
MTAPNSSGCAASHPGSSFDTTATRCTACRPACADAAAAAASPAGVDSDSSCASCSALAARPSSSGFASGLRMRSMSRPT